MSDPEQVGELRQVLQKVARGERMGRSEARQVLGRILRGQATPAQIGALLMGMRIRGESFEEISGFAEAMRQHAVPVDPRPEAIDLCGTGGDSAGTFNISTAASLLTAACGVQVAKHGNRSISSQCGSADVLEALKISIDLPPEKTQAVLDKVGFGFFFAPLYHPAMKQVAAPRKELGIRTVFNILGPMTNPAGVKRQLLGVYDDGLRRVMAEVLLLLGSERVWVVHCPLPGGGGLDEIGLCGSTGVTALENGVVKEFEISPKDAGLVSRPGASLQGGDASKNANRLLDIFNGVLIPERDAVILNAAAALHIAGKAENLKRGAKMAADAIDSGRATSFIEELRRGS